MQEKSELVSIIIPVYNTGEILIETLKSVFAQNYKNFELILIDDGSPVSPIPLVEELIDDRVVTIKQQNQGMAQTRNNGLEIAKGDMILFLDHDDVLAPDFLQKRIECLTQHQDIGFVGGPITTFPDSEKHYLSAAEKIEEEILFFNPNYFTTTSGYLFRRKTLADNNLKFNAKLSSTADRYLLLQLNGVTKGKRITDGMLFYRISISGFSQSMSSALVLDNELFLEEMAANNLEPVRNRMLFKMLNYYMLAGCNRQIGNYVKTIKYLFLSFISSPISFLKRILRPDLVIKKEIL